MTSAVYDFKAIKSQVKDGDWWKPAKDEAQPVVGYLPYVEPPICNQLDDYRGLPSVSLDIKQLFINGQLVDLTRFVSVPEGYELSVVDDVIFTPTVKP